MMWTKLKKLLEQHLGGLGFLFIFTLFFYISMRTPLAGDDWGYAINGSNNNPFLMAIDFYFNWSGRFFSELYGFLVAPNQWFWVWLNPLLFATMFILINKLSNPHKNILTSLVIIFLMISVKDELRMETYTWLMGTTYVIPLVLTFILIFYLNYAYFENKVFSRLELFALLIIVFIISMSMENISITVLLGLILFNIFDYIKNHKVNSQLILLLLVSIIGFALLRLSPGANFRLLRDHADWVSLSLIDQIIINYPNLIRFTFIEHRYLILSLSLVLSLKIVLDFIHLKKLTVIDLTLLIIFSFAAFISISLTASHYLNWSLLTNLSTYDFVGNLVFWPIFAIAVVYFLWIKFSGKTRILVLSFLFLAAISNGVMLLSPIFSYRSSLYTVYFIIALTALVASELKIKYSFFVNIALILLLFLSVKSYVVKYQEVGKAHQIRLEQIQYYLDHPEEKEAWLIRYPIYSIHSGDIEAWDIYHMDTFKSYFGLNPDMVLYFYYPE